MIHMVSTDMSVEKLQDHIRHIIDEETKQKFQCEWSFVSINCVSLEPSFDEGGVLLFHEDKKYHETADAYYSCLLFINHLQDVFENHGLTMFYKGWRKNASGKICLCWLVK